ncbi:MAG: ribosome silencing factor, partial [Nitrospinaceae bacterium]|nr:ribosome silencing factor [Nitrospinaceae bacterium]NIR54697.1 ribosome silencing factor [Nitrospinaceae bacterium]NIS85118.1 ribosome silencing factor [Nitrospinaceae bacterium]NIT81935.1 ribosome silencing factor [Nitrospinaceae bacterium]NIU44196.1 ribosome silencing factor [Nitrospinaceae bacterium]
MTNPLNELQRLIVEAAADKKAFDIMILDLRNRSDFTDYFMICSGSSRMQVQAIVDSILEKVFKSQHKLTAVEGYSVGNWVVVDLGDIV